MSERTEISFDAALMMALRADAQKELDELPTSAQLKERYPDTSRWDARLKAALHKRRPVLKRVLVAVLTLVILTLGALAVSADFRKAVYTMIQKFFPIEMQLTYQVDGEPLEQLPNGYSDHYVPDGFERDYEQGYDNEISFLHAYVDANDKSIFYYSKKRGTYQLKNTADGLKMTILTKPSKSSKKEYLYAVFSSVLLSQVIAILYPEKISAEQVEEEKAAVRKLFGAHKMPLLIELAITAAFVAFAVYMLYPVLYSDNARSKGISDGYFSAFPAGATVGEVLDDFFANGTWENYEQDGVTFVHYSGECVSTQTGEKATVGIYFKLNDDGSFEIDRMTMDGETMNLLRQNITLSEISNSYCNDHGIASSNALDELENALDDALADSSSSVSMAEPESETYTEDTDSDNSAQTATRSDRKVVSTNGMDTYSELSGEISVDVNSYEFGEMPESTKEYYLSYGSDFKTAWLNAMYTDVCRIQWKV